MTASIASPAATPGRFLERLTWPEVNAAFKSQVPVIFPVGAIAKEHGHHLPLNNDWLLARALAEGVAACLPVLIAPTISFGYYPVFRTYPGSQHLSAETFARLVTELLENYLDQGARRLAILNTGVSTESPIGLATRGILERRGIRVGVADIRRLGRAADHLLQQKFGSHADERETSIMLAIDPEIVRMDRARPDYGKEGAPGVFLTPSTMQSSDPARADFSETGAYGDPTLASAEKGRQLLAAMIEDLVSGLRGLFPDLSSSAQP